MDDPLDTTSTVLPHLLIAGVQKGGTTWLHAILGSHEDVFMSRVKELRYFDAFARIQSETAWREYLAHFADAGSYRNRLAHLYSDDVAYVRALLRRNVWQEAD